MLKWIFKNLPFGNKFSYLAINYFVKRTNRTFIVKTDYGFKIHCNTRDFIQRSIFNFKFWEPDISYSIAKILKPGDLFIDVGANIGYYSLLASSVVGAQGRVISVEAHPKVFGLLNKNIKLNDFKNISTVNVAAGRSEGSIELFTGPESSLGESTIVQKRGFTKLGNISVKPLTSIIPSSQINQVSLIKIDIEGAESEVLYNILDKIDLFDPRVKIISEISTDTDNREGIFEALKARGFRTYAVHNDYRESYYMDWVKPKIPIEVDRIPGEQCDIIFSREDIGHLFPKDNRVAS